MKRFLFFFLTSFIAKAQVLSPYSPTQTQPRIQFDYWVYSTNAGNGSTSQYPVVPASKADMDKLFDNSYSNTTLVQSGRTNDVRIIDWQATSTLSNMGITVPNSGSYFALKVQGNFIPTESGTYTFSIESDDASDITFNGTMMYSRYQGLAISNLGTNTFTVSSLVAGKSYPFIIRMQNGSGATGLRLYWKAPSQSGTPATGYTNYWTLNTREVTSTPDMDGSTAQRAAPSAEYIKNLTGTNTDGVYWINLPMVGPTQIYCIMNSAVNGGGWMMAMKATRGNTFNYDASYWTSFDNLNTGDNSRNDADAKFETMNQFPAKDIMAIFPDITGYTGTSNLSGYGWSWLQNNFNNSVRIRLVNFFNNVSRLFVQDAATFAGVTPFTRQTDVRFYGFNYSNAAYTSNMPDKARWGFGWNENGGGLFPYGNEASPDVAGGIGLSYLGTVNYSAGDYYGCCSYNGVVALSRSARVEIYVR